MSLPAEKYSSASFHRLISKKSLADEEVLLDEINLSLDIYPLYFKKYGGYFKASFKFYYFLINHEGACIFKKRFLSE